MEELNQPPRRDRGERLPAIRQYGERADASFPGDFEIQLRAIAAATDRLDHSVRRLEALVSAMGMRLTRAESSLDRTVGSEVPVEAAPEQDRIGLLREYYPQIIAGLAASVIALAVVLYLFSGSFR